MNEYKITLGKHLFIIKADRIITQQEYDAWVEDIKKDAWEIANRP